MVLTVPSVADRHLLNRFSFGASRPLVNQSVSKGGAAKWFAWQLYPKSITDTAGDAINTWYPHILQAPAKSYAAHDNRTFLRSQWGNEFVNWSMMRRVRSQRQLHEVMVQFWGNFLHVPVYDPKSWPLRKQYDTTLRTYALDTFENLLVAAVLHPAMSCYLDNTLSTASHLNENLGREVLELHTVGIDGGYTEAMVRDSARILTGYHVDQASTWSGSYLPENHATGTVRVLGFSHANSAADGRAVAVAYVKYLAHHPATAQRVARRLCAQFVSDNPTPAHVAAVANAFTSSGTSIKATIKALIAHPDFAKAVNGKVRTPDDDLVATWRALQVVPAKPGTGSTEFALSAHAKAHQMGNIPFSWPRPDGPPITDDAWAGTGRMLASWSVHDGCAWGFPSGHVTYRTSTSWLPTMPATLDTITDHMARQLHGRPASAAVKTASRALFTLPGTYRFPSKTSFAPWRVNRLLSLLLNTNQHMTR